MKLTTKQDVEAPVAFVWQSLTDFESWERAAMRRGADVTRTDTRPVPGPGMSWDTRFAFRGQDRTVLLRLTEMERAARLGFAGTSRLFEGPVVFELVDMSARRTRLHVTTEVLPLTLAARLLLQSLKLAKAKVTKKYDRRVAQLATELEQRHAAGMKG